MTLDTVARPDKLTPASFVERCGRGLRAHAQARRAALEATRSASAEVPAVCGSVDMLAGWIASLDLSDPRLFALSIAYGVLRDPDNPGEWVPGLEQSRVLSRLGLGGKFDPDMSLSELVSAAVEDVTSELRGRQFRAEAQAERQAAELEVLAPIAHAVALARAEVPIAALHREQDMAAVARRARLIALEAARDEPDTKVESSDSTLPTGVRAHGNLFEAYASVNGKRLSERFKTVEQADAQYKAWVKEREEAVA